MKIVQVKQKLTLKSRGEAEILNAKPLPFFINLDEGNLIMTIFSLYIGHTVCLKASALLDGSLLPKVMLALRAKYSQLSDCELEAKVCP